MTRRWAGIYSRGLWLLASLAESYHRKGAPCLLFRAGRYPTGGDEPLAAPAHAPHAPEQKSQHPRTRERMRLRLQGVRGHGATTSWSLLRGCQRGSSASDPHRRAHADHAALGFFRIASALAYASAIAARLTAAPEAGQAGALPCALQARAPVAAPSTGPALRQCACIPLQTLCRARRTRSRPRRRRGSRPPPARA